MNHLTPDENRIVREVSALMTRTMALAAQDRDAVGICRTQLMGPRHTQISIRSNPDDVPLIIGGKGTNAKTVRELSIGALPPGAFVETHLEAADAPMERSHRDFGSGDALAAELVKEITAVVVEWHQRLGGLTPAVNFETTPRCDIWLVQGRGIQGTAMGGLRRVIGWACKVRGRNGFIEWESY